jgi:hypothetical protein
MFFGTNQCEDRSLSAKDICEENEDRDAMDEAGSENIEERN